MGNPYGRKTHGLYYSPEQRVWNNMKQRCKNPKSTYWKHYGGRGISVCERWEKFENFYTDMGPRPSAKHSIDRIDNNGNYCKENCRWATISEQSVNRRNNHFYNINGELLLLKDIAKKYGIRLTTLKSRVYKWGYTIEEAIAGYVKRGRPPVYRPMPRKTDRFESRKTHCPAGHEYNDTNTYVCLRGHRACRICRKINKKKTYIKQRKSLSSAKDILGGE